MKYDVIIIGAGLGGLTAGAKLSKEGRKVLLIEQHTKVGGCATTFRRGDFTLEVGLHMMDGLDNDDRKVKIFNELAVYDNVEFIKVPEFYRFTNGRVDIVIPAHTEEAVKVLVEKFPDEEKGIKKFFHRILSIRKEISGLPEEKWKLLFLAPLFPFIYPYITFNFNRTAGDFLDSIIKNEDLKFVLMANIGYYHDNPHTMSLLFYAAAQGSFFSGGGYYIKGGSQKLSDYLAQIIKDNGGEIILNHLTTRILTEGNKAVGVKYKSKKTGQEQEVPADVIIANAAIPNVINDLLPPALTGKIKAGIDKLEIACSLLSIYLGFKKPVKELGNNHYSTFVFDGEFTTLSQFEEDPAKTEKGFVFVDYSQIDSALAPNGKSVGAIATIDYLSNWEHLSREEYQARKEKTARTIFDKLEKLIPGIKEEIEYYEVGTPRTIVRYTGNTMGSVYGFAQTPYQAGFKRIDNVSPIKNLYFASAWTRPGGGFTGAILSGYMCAGEVLKRS